MLSNCEKMAVISSTINEWPQNQIDEAGMNMGSTGRVMDQKPGGQEHQQPLKCPRCDSSNTKFCYYNNYSLSQPRHFCKACKRYWTRGGTLRNVPVGGGCRKNKRVKRPSSSSSSAAIDSPSSNSLPPPQIDTSSTSTHISPLFYNLPNNPLFNPRVSNVDTVSGYDLQPQLSGLGLGFSSGVDDYRNGLNPSKQIHSNSLFSSYNSMFGSASSTSPTMASLIASTLQQQKFINGAHKESRVVNHFQSFLPFQDMHIGTGMNNKEAKLEEAGQTRLEEWNNNYQTQIEQISHDPSLYWNPSTNAWPDLANLGSSSVL